jgi:hypothetical protein
MILVGLSQLAWFNLVAALLPAPGFRIDRGRTSSPSQAILDTGAVLTLAQESTDV